MVYPFCLLFALSFFVAPFSVPIFAISQQGLHRLGLCSLALPSTSLIYQAKKGVGFRWANFLALLTSLMTLKLALLKFWRILRTSNLWKVRTARLFHVTLRSVLPRFRCAPFLVSFSVNFCVLFRFISGFFSLLFGCSCVLRFCSFLLSSPPSLTPSYIRQTVV